MNSFPPPVAEYTTPNRMKYQTKSTEVWVVTPNTPCDAIVMISMNSGNSKPWNDSHPGAQGPRKQ